MRDENTKKSKFSWSKKLVKKWFNIKSKTEEFQADEVVYKGGDDVEWRNRLSESQREACAIKKSRSEKSRRSTERIRRKRADLAHPQIINVHNYSMFVSTWNVGGKSPSSDLNLHDFLHSAPPADIYVLGFQEVVPLNAGNILGAEDNGPAKKWLSLIRKILNNLPGSNSHNGSYTPSPIPNPITESDADFEGSTRNKTSFLPRRSLQTPSSWRDNDPSAPHPRRYSTCDQFIFGHRPSDYESKSQFSHRPSDCDPKSQFSRRPSDYGLNFQSCHRSSDVSYSHRPSDYDQNFRSYHRPNDSSFGHRPSDSSFGHRRSDYSCGRRASDSSSHRPSDYSWGHRPSVSSRWGSSDEDFWPLDSPSTVLPQNSRYCLVASKQMVGIYLTVWVKSDIREHVRNMKVSCVGRGLMGYLGNKGSISVSMLLHQTSFCFVCTHLTSGEKEGDELRRNGDVTEILRKTRFPRVKCEGDDRSPEPETILEHDRVIWLGDLNYRVALSYRTAKALVEMQNWRALLENDQLRLEQRRGRVFHGWKEGRIYFPPTYKYSNNSDRYSGADHPKEKRRTPAWCDRVLWHGRGLHQLSYVRGESKFSDHRPVYSLFWAEVESYQGRFRKSKSFSRSRIELEELLPYSHGYTDLCFF